MGFSLCLFLSILVNSILILCETSTIQLASDSILLADNDLTNEPASAAILLGSFVDFRTAKSSCELLGEKVWTPLSHISISQLAPSLSYQIFLGSYPETQLFWVAGERQSSCTAINANRQTAQVDCDKSLPTLCTQSAAMSNSTFSSVAAQFQITQQVGDISITGYRDFYSWKFLGVRFAPEPQRFAYSTVYDGSQNYSAITPGPACAQTGSVGSEDCLFLNIWTPYLPSPSATPKKKLKAVMVWIFGGGNVVGSANDAGNDGTNLASRGDVVVVNVNYRLGNLGYLALNDGVTNGNYGLQDIITALQWISQNIEAFGGDPSRVTVFGQSSGASTVRALLASPETKGLFSGAIMESTPVGFSVFAPYSNYSTIEYEVDTVANSILNLTGCLNRTDQLGCLRAVDAYALASLPVLAGYPVIDGTYLTSSGLSFAGNNSLDIPILLGTVRDEEAVTVPDPASSVLTVALEALSNLLSLDVTPFAASPYFPVPNSPDTNSSAANFNLTSRITTDGGLTCLTHATAYSSVLHSKFSSVYLYTFNRTYLPPSSARTVCVPPATPNYPNGDPDAEYYKCHAGEVGYVFGTIQRLGLPDRDGSDWEFSREILDRWAAFARTGDPNPAREFLRARGYSESGGKWKEVSIGKQKSMEMMWLQIDGGMVEVGEREQCEALGLPLDYFES